MRRYHIYVTANKCCVVVYAFSLKGAVLRPAFAPASWRSAAITCRRVVGVVECRYKQQCDYELTPQTKIWRKM